ncbi:MAG: radical SAM protein [bacterium]|nr:radical SAM protein [bacterium]
MRIVELYRSIQGESSYAGLPCTFIRTAGCSLRCTYCDTPYALDRKSGEEMPLNTLVANVLKMKTDLVEITGGEPLEQKETPALCQRLLEEGLTVLVETSGAYDLTVLPEDTITILDIKTPSSGMEKRNLMENLENLRDLDEVKFVIGTRDDFEWSLCVCNEYELFDRNEVLFAPVFGRLKPATLAAWILEDEAPVRLQIQQHKFIWTPDARGV